MQQSMLELFKKLAIAMLGQALPDASALSSILDDLRKGILASVITGVLIAALILLGCFGFYWWLWMQGLSQNQAVIWSAGLLIVVTCMSTFYAVKYLSRTEQAKEQLELFPEAEERAKLIEDVCIALAEGFCDQREYKDSKQQAGPEDTHREPD